MSQKLNEAAAREKTQKIISTELEKASKKPELHGRVQAITSISGIQNDEVRNTLYIYFNQSIIKCNYT